MDITFCGTNICFRLKTDELPHRFGLKQKSILRKVTNDKTAEAGHSQPVI